MKFVFLQHYAYSWANDSSICSYSLSYIIFWHGECVRPYYLSRSLTTPHPFSSLSLLPEKMPHHLILIFLNSVLRATWTDILVHAKMDVHEYVWKREREGERERKTKRQRALLASRGQMSWSFGGIDDALLNGLPPAAVPVLLLRLGVQAPHN